MVMMIIDDASADDIISMCMYLFPKGKGIVYESEIIHFGHKRQPSFLTTATFFKLYFGSKHFITFQIGEIPFLVKCWKFSFAKVQDFNFEGLPCYHVITTSCYKQMPSFQDLLLNISWTFVCNKFLGNFSQSNVSYGTHCSILNIWERILSNSILDVVCQFRAWWGGGN